MMTVEALMQETAQLSTLDKLCLFRALYGQLEQDGMKVIQVESDWDVVDRLPHQREPQINELPSQARVDLDPAATSSLREVLEQAGLTVIEMETQLNTERPHIPPETTLETNGLNAHTEVIDVQPSARLPENWQP